MSSEQLTQSTEAAVAPSPTCMESVNRFSKLPVVESTIQTATNLYEKVKEYNSVTNWTLSTAESTVNKAVEVGKPLASPVVRNLEGPIKKVDGMLCTGLDYVESKVPAVKLPPGEMYTSISNTVSPAVECAYSYAEPAVKTARDIVEPAVQSARTAMEPAVQSAVQQARSYVEPAVEKAHQMVGEFLHREVHNHEGDALECQDCQNIQKSAEHKTD